MKALRRGSNAMYKSKQVISEFVSSGHFLGLRDSQDSLALTIERSLLDFSNGNGLGAVNMSLAVIVPMSCQLGAGIVWLHVGNIYIRIISIHCIAHHLALAA